MRSRLIVLMVVAFVDMVGLVMLLPLLPFYATDFGATASIVGVLISAFSIAQLASSPVWGRVSDRYGRRPALLVGLGASGVAFIIFGYAGAWWMLVISRLVQGAGGGTTGVVQAYVGDAIDRKDRRTPLPTSTRRVELGIPCEACTITGKTRASSAVAAASSALGTSACSRSRLAPRPAAGSASAMPSARIRAAVPPRPQRAFWRVVRRLSDGGVAITIGDEGSTSSTSIHSLISRFSARCSLNSTACV